MLGFTGDGVFLLTLAFLMKDSITWVAPVMATALLLALRWLVEVTTGPLGGWIGDRFGARRISIVNGALLVAGFVLIAARSRAAGRAGRGHDARHVQHADPGAGARARQVERAVARRRATRPGATSAPRVGPLSAPWLFLNIPQAPLYAALAAALGIAVYFCLVRRYLERASRSPVI